MARFLFLGKFFLGLFIVISISSASFSQEIEKQGAGIEKGHSSYIQKASGKEGFKVFVIGDSLGEGLWQGLFLNFKDDEKNIAKIEKYTKTNTGIVRSDRFNWMREVKKIAQEDFQIAIMMFGANDAQSIRSQTIQGKAKRYHYQTPQWEEEYKKRIDEMIVELKKRDIAVYWVGLPNVKKKDRRGYHEYFNKIFKKQAEIQRIKFIDTWAITNDREGNYQPTGFALSGNKTILRARDGTHFTAEGYRVLARLVENVLRPDMQEILSKRSTQ